MQPQKMEFQEYQKIQEANAKQAAVAAYLMFSSMSFPVPSDVQWVNLLEILYPTVQEKAWETAEAARNYYDYARALKLGAEDMHEVYLASISFDKFVRDMEPVRKIAKSTSDPSKVANAISLRVARSVENSGRRTIIRAIESPDPAIPEVAEPIPHSEETGPPKVEEPPKIKPQQRRRTGSIVRGWARVPTGRETCGFCWMLASRGPVYNSAREAGSKAFDRDAVQLNAAGLFSAEDMNQWHDGCDCVVVPVFDQNDWEGKDKYEAAWDLWKDVVHKGGHSGQDAINAYRRAVERGDIFEYIKTAKVAA